MEYVLNLATLPGRILNRSLGVWIKRALWHLHDHLIPHPRNNYHPHLLSGRALSLFSMLLVSVKVASIVFLTAGPILPAYSSAITAANVFSLTNQSRQDFFLATLHYNTALERAAQAKADDMLKNQYFAHNTPDGRTPWDFFKNAGYNYLVAGENLAVDFTDSESQESAWMNSPGHRANILNKNFEEIGIGIAQGEFQGHTAIIVAQYFGTAAVQPVVLLNQPTLVAEPRPVALQPPAILPAQSLIPTAQAAELASKPNLEAKAIASPPHSPTAISIDRGDYSVKDDQVLIKVTTQGPVSKVMAQFGELAVFLSPLSDASWQGSVALSKLAQVNASVIVEAFGMQGQKAHIELANFSPSLSENYNLLAAQKNPQIKIFGWQFDPRTFVQRFYLFFIAGILSALVLAIAVRRHVQHLNLVANTSFVAILACLLWLGG